MAVHESEIQMGVKILREFGARKVVLFGSAMTSPANARDIDLGCEGVPPEKFYRAAGALISALGRNVDLIDLAEDDRRTRFIRDHSRVLYEA